MSIKTLRKRIALVAVSALSAGLMSVVAAPVANAALDIGDVDFVAKSTNGVDVINIGSCTFTNTNAAGTTVGVFTTGSEVSLVGTGIAAGDTFYAAISGPAVWTGATVAAGTTASATFNAANTTLTDGTAAVADVYKLRLTGVGTVTVSWGASATVAPTDVITISSVASCANGAYSAAYSFTMVDDAVANNATSNVDDALSAAAGDPLYIKAQLNDVYAAAIAAGTVSASATNGAVVNWGTPGTAQIKGTLSSASANAAQHVMVRVDPASAAAGGSTVVTLSVNGTVFATKTLLFYGEAKSIKITGVRSGRTGTSNAGTNATGFFTYQYLDANGVSVPGGAATFDATTANTTVTTITSMKAPTLAAAAVANANFADAQEALIGSTRDGVFTISCATTSGKSTVKISHDNAISGATLTATQEVTCAGGIATYTVSTDKASYNVGEIAEITITAKDSSGNPVSDNTVLTAGSVSVGGGSLTATIAGTEVFTGGVAKLKAQMTTAGTFNTVVSLAGSVTTSATTGYKVTDGAVSNTEVLAAIVKLIASINKQIKALQKSLRR